jgi:hypothetical protein
MPDSIQEQIVKKIVAALAQITVVKGFDNTVASVQRLNQDGIVLAVVPTILVTEGDCNVELAESIFPSIRRRMAIEATVAIRQDETASSLDLRSGGEQLNSWMADMEKVVANNRTWDGLAIQTDPPSYLETVIHAEEPHLGRTVRFEVIYQHVRTDPYSQA